MTLRGTRIVYIAFVTAVIGGAILLRYQDPFFVRALRKTKILRTTATNIN